MDPTPDELAGVVDLFDALTRDELHRAIENLAARAGSDFDSDLVDERLDEALEAYVLVALEREADSLYATGPAAFPTLPDDGGDLPHMMDVPEREVDRLEVADAVQERLRSDAVDAIQAGDDARITELLDLCYEIDAWASIDLSETRERLDAALED